MTMRVGKVDHMYMYHVSTLAIKVVYLKENHNVRRNWPSSEFFKFNFLLNGQPVGSQNIFELKELDCFACKYQEWHLIMYFTKQVPFSHELTNYQHKFNNSVWILLIVLFWLMNSNQYRRVTFDWRETYQLLWHRMKNLILQFQKVKVLNQCLL